MSVEMCIRSRESILMADDVPMFVGRWYIHVLNSFSQRCVVSLWISKSSDCFYPLILVYESAISLQISIAGMLHYAQTSESECPKKDIGS